MKENEPDSCTRACIQKASSMAEHRRPELEEQLGPVVALGPWSLR